MTLAQLLESRGVEAQLYPVLPEIGMKIGEYSKRRQEATDKLLTAGYLVMPTERADIEKAISETDFKNAMAEVVELLDRLGSDQHLLFPIGSPVLFNGGESRLSKLPTQKVKRYDGLPYAEKSKTLGMLTDDMIRSVGLGGRLIGYDFVNSKDERNMVQLVDVIRANEMMQDSYDPKNVNDLAITKTPDKKYRAGVSAIVKAVPSADEPGKKYDIALSHIVLADASQTLGIGLSDIEAGQTFDLLAKDPCPKDTKIVVGYGRQTKTTENLLIADENLIDHHVIFAYLAYQKFISESNEGLFVPDLFPKSTKGFRDTYFWPLYSRALKEVADESGNITRMPLAMGEIEGILWSVIGYKNEQRKAK